MKPKLEKSVEKVLKEFDEEQNKIWFQTAGVIPEKLHMVKMEAKKAIKEGIEIGRKEMLDAFREGKKQGIDIGQKEQKKYRDKMEDYYLGLVERKDKKIKQAQHDIAKEVEKEFDMQHACGCPEWCDCWKKFKKRKGIR